MTVQPNVPRTPASRLRQAVGWGGVRFGQGILALCLLVVIVSATGAVILSQPKATRWVIEDGAVPLARWIGYPDLVLTVQDSNWQWVHLGNGRLQPGLDFDQALVGVNPWSPYFGQIVVQGAGVSLAETAESWEIVAPAQEQRSVEPLEPLALSSLSLPDLQQPEGWWSHPSALKIGVTLINSWVSAQALPFTEQAQGPLVQATVTLFQARADLGDLLAGRGLSGRAEAVVQTSAAAAFGLDPARVQSDSGLTVAVSAPWRWSDGQLDLLPGHLSGALAAGFSLDGLTLPKEMAFSISPVGNPQNVDEGGEDLAPTQPMVRILLPRDEGETTVLPEVQVEVEPFAVQVDGEETLSVTGALADVRGILTVGETAPSMIRDLKVSFENSAFDLLGATAENLQASITVDRDRPRLEATADLLTLPGMGAPAAKGGVYPLRLTLDAQRDSDPAAPLSHAVFGFHAALATANGQALMSAKGTHDLATEQGEARVRLLPLTFRPGGLQPEQVIPLLGGTVSETSGRVSASGTVRWTAKGIAPDMTLALENVALRHGFLTLEEMTGVLRLTQFWPPRTPKGQQLSIARIQAGLPLSNGVVVYHLDGKGGLEVEEARLAFADGSVEVQNSHITLSPLSGVLPLKVRALDLAALATYGQLEGLTASGALSGTVPVRLTDADIFIENGTLSSQGSGFVRYRPADRPAALAAGGSVDLLMQALDDFQYQDLSLTLNGAASGSLEAGLHLKGANPALYDGFPIEFNLSLSGALSQLVSDTLATTSVPEKIQKRVEEIMGQTSP